MNLFVEDNEFGKSTILSFIRAMFYGFSRNSSRMKENDRRKFTPWNGKSFGGSVEFQHGGRTYLLEKTFLKRKADDKTSLTLLPSGQKIDLAQSDVGEYLFAISEAEFINTVFVGQLASNFSSSEKETADISARLANLAGTGNELYSYEQIKARLVGASSKLLALRGPGGLIPQIEEELSGLQDKETEIEESEKQALILEQEINAAREKDRLIRDAIQISAGLIEEKKKQSELIRSEQQRYEILLQTASQKKLLEQEQAAGKADMERERREHRLQIESMRHQLAQERVNIEEELERLGRKSEEDRVRAALMTEDIDALIKNQEAQLRENKALFDNKYTETNLIEEEILVVSSELKSLISQREDIRKGSTVVFGYKMPARRYEILFMAALAVDMAVFLIIRDPVLLAGLIFILMTAALLILNLIQQRKIEKKLLALSQVHEAKLELFENASASQYDRETTLEESRKRRDELILQKLRLQENIQRDKKYRAEAEASARDRLTVCIARAAQFASGTDPLRAGESGAEGEAVQTIQTDVGDPLESPDSAYDPADKEADTESLAKKIKSSQIMLAGIREEITAMLLQAETLRTESSVWRVNAARKETVRENILSRLPDRSLLLEQRELLTERLDQAKAYHRALRTAQKVLDESFSEMENFFAPQVNEKAGEYLAKLTDGTYSTLHVDRSFSVDVASEGSYSFHTADYFSGGTVDQIYLALRLAIADLVQPSDDKMPLLLDDAFVQYDDKRAKAGLALLDELSLNRQTVLFTCHKRMSDLHASIKDGKGSKSE